MKNFLKAKRKNFMNNQKNKKNRKINWKSPVHHKNSIEKKVKKKF